MRLSRGGYEKVFDDPRFRAYSGFGYGVLGLPTALSYNSCYTLVVSLDVERDEIAYMVGDLSTTNSAYGSEFIGNAMLQGQNTKTGVDYDIYWDNLTAVPEPSTVAYIGIALVGLGLHRVRKHRATRP